MGTIPEGLGQNYVLYTALWSLMQLSSSWLRNIIYILTPSTLVFVSRHLFNCVTYPQFWGAGKWAERDLEFQNVRPKYLKWTRGSLVGKPHVIYTWRATSVYVIHRLTFVFLQTICRVLDNDQRDAHLLYFTIRLL